MFVKYLLVISKYFNILYLADGGSKSPLRLIQLFLTGVQTLLEITVLSPQLLPLVLYLVSLYLAFPQLLGPKRQVNKGGGGEPVIQTRSS